jgi:hypothetical protein
MTWAGEKQKDRISGAAFFGGVLAVLFRQHHILVLDDFDVIYG